MSNFVFYKQEKYFEFWTIFSRYFFDSTYTRVDLYASIYGSFPYRHSATEILISHVIDDLVILCSETKACQNRLNLKRT